MLFADLALSKRLEGAEGHACAQFAEAHLRHDPASRAEWRRIAGAYVVFDGVDSPTTQTFGLGLFEDISPGVLQDIEEFFFDRGAPADHEVSPFAGVATLDMLCARHYRPTEISAVQYQSVLQLPEEPHAGITVRVAQPDEASIWSDVAARGWIQELPELQDFLHELGSITFARTDVACFIAESEGVPAAAAVLCVHDGVALFGGAATVPEFRRRGLQRALLTSRMRYACDAGCDLAMMVAAVGSSSQRNAARAGFHVAYTRTKWRRVLASINSAPPG